MPAGVPCPAGAGDGSRYHEGPIAAADPRGERSRRGLRGIPTHPSACTKAQQPILQFTPDNLEIVFLAFEGPDQPYSQAGGLGVRVTQFTRALAQNGFHTHLVFVGDPDLPGHEDREGGRLHLHRWCQWLSRYHRSGVYENEIAKADDYAASVPWFVTDAIVRPAVACGRQVAVVAEDWHPAEALCRTSDSLYFLGLRSEAVLVWNANNDMSFDRINWGRIGYVAGFATVSHYVKHQMWARGVNPVVVPNGVPTALLAPVDPAAVAAVRAALACDVLFFKLGRMDPDKGWVPAVEALARLRERGVNARLIIRGGSLEAHGAEVFSHMAWRHVYSQDVHTDDRSPAGIAAALARAGPRAPVLNLRFFVPDVALPVLYAAADGVLANSGYEPFGLVGLEAMAAGGVAYVGATGEEYSVPLQNAVVLDDIPDPEEIVHFALMLREAPAHVAAIRRNARDTATQYTWDAVIAQFLTKLWLLADRQGMRSR